jgi:DNA-binding NarL/FixJ family response regulator
MSEPPIRVILADDHLIVLQGLRELFQRHRGFDVVACCRTGQEALAAVRAAGADVLVLDLHMPGGSGLDVLRAMPAETSGCRTVLLTATISDDDAVEAIRLGAMGLVLKESTPDALIQCVRQVHQGHQWIDRTTMGRAFSRVSRRESAALELATTLSAREMDIVRLVAQGLRNREIGQRLFISEGTVKVHLHSVYGKLGVDGRLELVLYVQGKGLV